MTLSSAEKHSDTCPWRFPPVQEELIQKEYHIALHRPTTGCEAPAEQLLFSLSLEDIVDGKYDGFVCLSGQ